MSYLSGPFAPGGGQEERWNGEEWGLTRKGRRDKEEMKRMKKSIMQGRA